jgi:ABC-type transport system involved in cytochrome bd biosynthesis fused ATPase/permease subunit
VSEKLNNLCNMKAMSDMSLAYRTYVTLVIVLLLGVMSVPLSVSSQTSTVSFIATTTVNLSICGNSLVDSGEQCDVPGETGAYSTTILGTVEMEFYRRYKARHATTAIIPMVIFVALCVSSSQQEVEVEDLPVVEVEEGVVPL